MKAIVLVLVLVLAARLHATIWLPAGHLTVPGAGLVLAAMALAAAGTGWAAARRIREWPHVAAAHCVPAGGMP